MDTQLNTRYRNERNRMRAKRPPCRWISGSLSTRPSTWGLTCPMWSSCICTGPATLRSSSAQCDRCTMYVCPALAPPISWNLVLQALGREQNFITLVAFTTLADSRNANLMQDFVLALDRKSEDQQLFAVATNYDSVNFDAFVRTCRTVKGCDQSLYAREKEAALCCASSARQVGDLQRSTQLNATTRPRTTCGSAWCGERVSPALQAARRTWTWPVRTPTAARATVWRWRGPRGGALLPVVSALQMSSARATPPLALVSASKGVVPIAERHRKRRGNGSYPTRHCVMRQTRGCTEFVVSCPPHVLVQRDEGHQSEIVTSAHKGLWPGRWPAPLPLSSHAGLRRLRPGRLLRPTPAHQLREPEEARRRPAAAAFRVAAGRVRARAAARRHRQPFASPDGAQEETLTALDCWSVSGHHKLFREIVNTY